MGDALITTVNRRLLVSSHVGCFVWMLANDRFIEVVVTAVASLSFLMEFDFNVWTIRVTKDRVQILMCHSNVSY